LGWLFGYPSIPAFDFTYGGGVTSHNETQSVFIVGIVLSLLASVTFALIWSILQSTGSGGATVFFGLYIFATTVLFGSVPWSKFAHMFFKPAAALQKRVSEADGSRSKLPAPADKPEILGSTRHQPRHY
jgi:hypothetical protein